MKGEIIIHRIIRATEFVHHILKGKIQPGNIVVDGTMGNGNDTLFLSKLVTPLGKVVAFDIQKIAIENTKNKLIQNNIELSFIELINDGHENIKQYVNYSIDAAMFNLGYLPGTVDSIITKPETTIKAVDSAIQLLKPEGIISIVIYYGHKGGVEERDRLIAFLNNISSKKATVMISSYANHENNPPIIAFIEKNN